MKRSIWNWIVNHCITNFPFSSCGRIKTNTFRPCGLACCIKFCFSEPSQNISWYSEVVRRNCSKEAGVRIICDSIAVIQMKLLMCEWKLSNWIFHASTKAKISMVAVRYNAESDEISISNSYLQNDLAERSFGCLRIKTCHRFSQRCVVCEILWTVINHTAWIFAVCCLA